MGCHKFFTEQLKKLGVDASDINFQAIEPPKNMIIQMDRILACLTRITNPMQRKAFIEKIPQLNICLTAESTMQ